MKSMIKAEINLSTEHVLYSLDSATQDMAELVAALNPTEVRWLATCHDRVGRLLQQASCDNQAE